MKNLHLLVIPELYAHESIQCILMNGKQIVRIRSCYYATSHKDLANKIDKLARTYPLKEKDIILYDTTPYATQRRIEELKKIGWDIACDMRGGA